MKAICMLLFLGLVACKSENLVEYRSSDRFEKDIQKFEAQDTKSMPPQGAVVVTGSSSVRMWHKRMAKDLQPLTVIPRGFGGSNMNDLLHFSERIIAKYNPRAVAIYEGDNDIAQNISPKQVKEKFIELKDKLLVKNKDLRFYIISVKPSIKRWAMWPDMIETNRIMREFCEENENFFFIDTASVLLKDGKARDDIFIKDMLHLNEKGYDLWAAEVRKTLVANELKYEKN